MQVGPADGTRRHFHQDLHDRRLGYGQIGSPQ